MITLTDISKGFGNGEFALKNISLSLEKGLHLLVGPNGAGKSTLLRILANVTYPDVGSISFYGRDIHSDLHGFKSRMGYLPQVIGFYEHMNGIEFLRYMACLKGVLPRYTERRVDEVIQVFGIGQHANKKIATWSIGLRQRLGLAQALLNDPDLLILDEPFCGLDLEEADEVGQLISRLSQNKIVLFSSHVMQKLAISKLLLLIDGTLQFAGLSTVFLDEAQGRVWLVDIAKEQWTNIQAKYLTSTVLLKGNRYQCKIISESKPDIEGASSIMPGVEEAYLFWLSRYHLASGEKTIC